VRDRYVFWRIRIPLWLAATTAGWALWGIPGLVAGGLVAYVAEGVFSYHKPGPRSSPIPEDDRAAAEEFAAAEAEAWLIERRWETDARPSPGGWRPPAGSLPGWQWSPPDGLRPRFDRVPVWVRVWYKTPFVDRYAYAWMWRHGGWDVLPPAAQDS